MESISPCTLRINRLPPFIPNLLYPSIRIRKTNQKNDSIYLLLFIKWSFLFLIILFIHSYLGHCSATNTFHYSTLNLIPMWGWTTSCRCLLNYLLTSSEEQLLTTRAVALKKGIRVWFKHEWVNLQQTLLKSHISAENGLQLQQAFLVRH